MSSVLRRNSDVTASTSHSAQGFADIFQQGDRRHPVSDFRSSVATGHQSSVVVTVVVPAVHCSGVARNLSQEVRNSNCLQFSTYALRCFCEERNFDRRTRHH